MPWQRIQHLPLCMAELIIWGFITGNPNTPDSEVHWKHRPDMWLCSLELSCLCWSLPEEHTLDHPCTQQGKTIYFFEYAAEMLIRGFSSYFVSVVIHHLETQHLIATSVSLFQNFPSFSLVWIVGRFCKWRGNLQRGCLFWFLCTSTHPDLMSVRCPVGHGEGKHGGHPDLRNCSAARHDFQGTLIMKATRNLPHNAGNWFNQLHFLCHLSQWHTQTEQMCDIPSKLLLRGNEGKLSIFIQALLPFHVPAPSWILKSGFLIQSRSCSLSPWAGISWCHYYPYPCRILLNHVF